MIDINKRKILGRGATANIYEAKEGSKLYAAKIYTTNKVMNLEKIEAMIAHSPKDSVMKITKVEEISREELIGVVKEEVEIPTQPISLIGQAYGIIAKQMDVNTAKIVANVLLISMLIIGYLASHYLSKLLVKRNKKIKNKKIRKRKKERKKSVKKKK